VGVGNLGCNRLGQWLVVIWLLLFLTACSRNAVDVATETELRMLNARYGHAAVTDGKQIFIIAGSNAKGFLSDVEVYDPETGQIEHWQTKLIPRRYFSAVWDGQGSIYIIGGESITGKVWGLESRVEVLNTKTGEVTLAQRLPLPTRANTAVFAAGKIVVFGGSRLVHNKLLPSSTVAVYDVAAKRWFKVADMPIPRDTRAVVKDDWIYLVGGYTQKVAVKSFERFNPITYQWQTLPSLPTKLSAHSATIWQNKLVVFGDYENMTSTYGFDFDKAQWQKLELDYKASRHNAAVTFNDEIYVFGGNTGRKGPFHNYIQKFRF
jgi:N-acetylneuraminic acid mutarotase